MILLLHYITQNYTNYTTLITLHCTELHWTALHHRTLHYNYNYNYFTHTTLHYTRLHYSHTLHYTRVRNTTVHYITLLTLHHTTSSSCGWGDHCKHYNDSKKKHSSDHLSVRQWIRSAIRDSQQPTSPIGVSMFETSAAALCATIGMVVFDIGSRDSTITGGS